MAIATKHQKRLPEPGEVANVGEVRFKREGDRGRLVGVSFLLKALLGVFRVIHIKPGLFVIRDRLPAIKPLGVAARVEEPGGLEQNIARLSVPQTVVVSLGRSSTGRIVRGHGLGIQVINAVNGGTVARIRRIVQNQDRGGSFGEVLVNLLSRKPRPSGGGGTGIGVAA